MLLEGILGLTSVVAVAALTSKAGCPGALGLYVCGGSQYLGTFGMGSLVGKGIMALMVLILGLTLTQLALRFARLAISEMVKLPALKNVYVTSIIVSIITFLLTSTRFGAPWGFIWTLFGGSNQLLAGVTLLVATLWLTKSRRRGVFTGVPAIFMLVTTIAALGYTAYATLDIAFTTNIATSATRAYGSAVAGIIAIILTVLGIVLSYDGFKAYRGIRGGLTGTPSVSTGMARASQHDNPSPVKTSAPRSPEEFGQS
jgi:carbon starvation protein